MSKEQELEINSALKGHFKPSSDTINFMEKTTEEITNIKIDMKGVKKDLGYIIQKVDKLEIKFDSFINECRKEYSSKKQVEKQFEEQDKKMEKLSKFMIKVMWTSVTALFGLLMTIIWFLIDNFVAPYFI